MMAIYLIALMCALLHAGYGGSRVVLALYALNLGADQFTIGTIMALKALCPTLLALYAGKLVDRVGPRLPMLWGSVGSGIALALPYFFPGLSVLYVSVVILGTSFQFFFVAVQGTTGALGGPEDRARNYSIIAIGFSLAAFVGPLIAGFSIDYLGYLPAYLVLAATTVIPIVLLWMKPEVLPKATLGTAGVEPRKSALDLLHNAKLRNTLIASGLIATAWDLYLFYFPIYGNSIGLSASVIGMVSAVFAVAVFVIRVALPGITRRWGEYAILVYAIAIAGVAFLLFPWFENPYLLACVSFLLGLGLGCGQPLSMSLIYSLAPRGRASESAGMRVTFNNFTHMVVPLAFGGIGTVLGFAPVFMFGASLLLAGSYYGYRNERAAFQRAP
jgi:MFS family permease